MITIKKYRSPKLPQCGFLWDVKLENKLEKYEFTKFLNCHSTNLLIGKPRSGKTSLLYSLFKSKHLLKKVFENIFLFQPSHSRLSMKDKRLFDQLDNKFDDMGAYLKDNQIKQLLKELVMNRRHYHTSIFFYVKRINQLKEIYEHYFLMYFCLKYLKKKWKISWMKFMKEINII